MSRFSGGGTRAGTNTAGTEYFAIQSNSATTPIRIREIGIGISVAPTTAPDFYLARRTTAGTASTTLAGVANDGNNTATSAANFLTLSANGTFSTTNFIRRGGLATTAGGLLIWTFYDEPLIIAPATTNGISIVNASASGATTGTFSAYATWDE